MFCPKCGTDNPETGKFCRSCGTDLGNVSEALSGNLAKPVAQCDRRGRPITWESTIRTFFMGLAFLTVAIVLGVTSAGRGWWFWMLIPAFIMIGGGVAKYVQLKKAEQQAQRSAFPMASQATLNTPRPNSGLPPMQAQFVAPVPESRYKTGDLVPPSVTDGTTRHLEANPEGETMTLPKV